MYIKNKLKKHFPYSKQPKFYIPLNIIQFFKTKPFQFKFFKKKIIFKSKIMCSIMSNKKKLYKKKYSKKKKKISSFQLKTRLYLKRFQEGQVFCYCFYVIEYFFYNKQKNKTKILKIMSFYLDKILNKSMLISKFYFFQTLKINFIILFSYMNRYIVGIKNIFEYIYSNNK